MTVVEGNIIDVIANKTYKGKVFYTNKIEKIVYDASVQDDRFILPGLIDAHVHIESSMLTPLEYSKIAVKHGVVAAITDPHEIANVCGIEGIRFMINNAKMTPMKLFFGAPSCVPATPFETSGAVLTSKQIEELFVGDECSHLSEMMNFPGVIYNDSEVLAKLLLAQKYNKRVDGHAPQLAGEDLIKYVSAGISTDHECTTLAEANEKINLGMKIMLRQSSASRDFQHLISLIHTNPNESMLCTDDCHPDDLLAGYINELVKKALKEGYSLYNVLSAATKTAVQHYGLNVGLLQLNDPADFIVVDNLNNFNVLQTVINGEDVYCDGEVLNKNKNNDTINQFYENNISINDLKVKQKSNSINVIEVVEDSLLTGRIVYLLESSPFIESNIEDDVLKVVVLNRYKKALPSIGFIKGFNLKKGAIAGTIAHDSHNIVAVGVSDDDLLKAICEVQKAEGGLCVTSGDKVKILPLPIAGLMSDKSCSEVASQYRDLSQQATSLGCTLNAPFMTLAFMSLLVIPELKLGDRGLFDVNKFDFIDLQN